MGHKSAKSGGSKSQEVIEDVGHRGRAAVAPWSVLEPLREENATLGSEKGSELVLGECLLRSRVPDRGNRSQA